MPADDLGVLPIELQSRAHVQDNGEVFWHVRDTSAVVDQLAQPDRVVHRLDVRDCDEDGRFFEVAWSVYDGAEPIEDRDAALRALAHEGLPGEWVLITWRS